MKPGEETGVVETADLRQTVRQQVEHRVRLPDEGVERHPPVGAVLGQTIEQPALQASGFVGGGQPGQGQPMIGLESRIGGLEAAAALLVEQPGDVEVEVALRIGRRPPTVRLDVQAPAGAQPAQGVVQARADRHQLLFGGGLQVRPAEAETRQEGAVLV